MLKDAGAASGLLQLKFGNSGALLLGCFVIALGHPFGIRGGMVTLGVLFGCIVLHLLGSAARPAQDGDSKDDVATFLVTDAALGGSMLGGPLCCEDGRVVGVSALVDGRLRGLGNLAVCRDCARRAAGAIVVRGKADDATACREIRLMLYNSRFNISAWMRHSTCHRYTR